MEFLDADISKNSKYIAFIVTEYLLQDLADGIDYLYNHCLHIWYYVCEIQRIE